MTTNEFNDKLIEMNGNLRRFAMSLTADRNDASDLIQDTYLKAITFRNKFADNSNLKAWVFTIMKNTFINNYRRGVKENNLIDTTKDLYYVNLSVDKGFVSPESNYSAKEIIKAIEGLDDEFKIPFIMHLEGYKYQEIAEKLNLKIGTVKSRIFFSRRKLMKILGDYN
ncbi:MAG TPA: RNA polymerase sigma factor [Bacteroidales bacterium]|nr:RNA polymerase sigma factor [Bacteroidales bacterium]HCI55309.1 RNA polymerase subunit sigma [Bacteroidales bacterium]HOU95829.1 RNA polymerase sigma factor [Bacteroidales bacterium]HQG36899.1 RNA polymerase sigma factor [Bacteroidales bacterium]HQG52602.1 RNA polymerase sigma factor [Bacteroidales bacterium]